MKKKYSLFFILLLLSHFNLAAQVTYEEAFPSLNFAFPVEIQCPNDGTNRMFVLEQEGRIKVFTINKNATSSNVSTFLDITSQVQGSGGQELGLLGLAFHPDFNNNGFFYVYYTVASPISGISTRMVLSRFTVNSGNINIADSTSELVLFQFDKNQNNSNHNGGKIVFGPDGYLYISFGDGGGGGDPMGNGQNKNTVFGSICRIDVDLDGSNPIETNSDLPNGNYEIPNDNPFLGTAGLDEIYAYGFRNTWKFSFDNITGRLWGADVGQGSLEEINLIDNGENYGWNRYEGNSIYNSSTIITGATKFPVFEYNHNQGDVSITGGYVYRGSEITSTNPSINSKYIFGDYVSGRVWALDYNQSTGLGSSTLLFKTNGNFISSFGEDELGELYFSDYRGNAKIYKLVDGTAASSGVLVNGFGTWGSLDEGVPNGIVYALATDANGNVYHGGSFNQVGSLAANNIALWNESSGWSLIGSGTNGVVNALKVDSNDNLYAAGSFTEINGVTVNNIAKWNGVQWTALGSGIDGSIAALSIDASGNVFAGGIFETINGLSARNIAKWNGTSWSVLQDASTGDAGTNNEIRSLHIDGSGILYAGGNFDEAGGRTANRIATWDGSIWGTLGAGTSGFVEAITSTNTDVYIGGNFAIAGGINVNRIAKWEKSTSTWSSLGNGLNNNVTGLIHDGTYLFAAGTFDIAFNSVNNGIIVNNIARFSTANNWQALGTNTNVGVDIKINSINFAPGTFNKIYASGNFNMSGLVNVNNTAVWLSENALDISEYNTDDLDYIYPNPTNGKINLLEENEWEFISILGKTLALGKGKELDISKFTSGIYFLKIINGPTFKIIKI